tara:strand:+ start:103 stop:684 length:582 start_codon:yes stop_codon:yes gene_type:complete
MKKPSNLEKVISLFNPDENGYSRRVRVEEIENSNLTWSKNGNGRRGKFFGVQKFKFLVERGKGNKVISLKLDGLNESIILNQTIRKDIKDKLNEQNRSNFAPDCLIPLVDNDKEIDHRWGRKDSPLYDRINDTKKQSIDDFQLLSHSHNQFKREQCKKCTMTNVRYDATMWDDSVGCSGCPLAQPELYRGELF